MVGTELMHTGAHATVTLSRTSNFGRLYVHRIEGDPAERQDPCQA